MNSWWSTSNYSFVVDRVIFDPSLNLLRTDILSIFDNFYILCSTLTSRKVSDNKFTKRGKETEPDTKYLFVD